MLIRKLIRVVLLALAISPFAHAANWPDKPVTIVVPFPAGGTIDVVMRAVAPQMGEQLGQPVVIENVAGAGGALGAARVAQAPPDGSVILAGSTNDVVLQPLLNPDLGYSSQNLEPIALAFTSPLVLVGRTDLPQDTIDAIIERLKKSPESISFGSPGQGTLQHLIMEDLQHRTQTRMLHVPYKGAAPLLNDVLGGHVDMAIMGPPAAMPYVGQGRLKFLGVVGRQRLPAYPDLPTINESHTVKGLDLSGWVGLLAPRGVPKDRQERVRRAFATVMQRQDVRQRVTSLGMEPATAFDATSFAGRIAADAELMRLLTAKLQH